MNKTKQTNKQHMRTRKTTYVMMLIIIMVWTLVLFTHAFDHAYATQIDSNPHLRVSAEGQNDGNVIASTNIVEIVVIDELTNSDDRMPTVRVDGELFTMYFHSSAWYGYFADDGILDTGLADDQEEVDSLVQNAPVTPPTTSNLVALLDLDGEFDIVYQRPGGDETVTLELDDPNTDISLDRTAYPLNADVLVTIEDYALNVDPTSKDTWWMHDPGDPTYGMHSIDGPQAFGQALVDRQKAINDAFVRFDDPHHRNDQRLHNAIAEANNDPDKIRLAQIEYARIDNTLHANYFAAYRAAIQAFNAEISRIAIEFAELRSVPGFGKFDIVGNSQLVCSNKLTECIVVRAPGEDHGKNWVWFMEEGRNESTFTNTNNNGETTALASPDFYAKRGGQFSFEYDDNRVYAILTYETSDIDIDTDDMWSSGQEVDIMLLDSDMNLSSLNEDQLSSIDRRYVIPTIRIGEPFTLAESKEIMMKDNDGSGNSAIIHHYRVIENSDAVVFEYINDYTAGDQLVIELGGWSNFKKYLPQHISSFKGVHMLNYDISSINGSSISLQIGTLPEIPLVTGSRGIEIVADTISDESNSRTNPFAQLYDSEGNILDLLDTEASLVVTISGRSDELYPILHKVIVIDLFTIGFEDDNNNLVNNAIYRLELKESDDNTQNFKGTIEYTAINQINAHDISTYERIDALGDSIVMISNDESISVEYYDIDDVGRVTQFTVKQDTPTQSGMVLLDSKTYRVGETVTVTVTDADLNTSSDKLDVYTGYQDKISSKAAVMELLTVSIDGNPWVAGCDGMTGLGATQFTLRETKEGSGNFTGTFTIPETYCAPDGNAKSVTGADITVQYIDFRNDHGNIISSSASAGIRSVTGVVTLDRAVYPVPFGNDADANAILFETQNSANPLPYGDLTAYIRIDDADFNTSSDGVDKMNVVGPAPLTVSIIRGSSESIIGTAGNTSNPISETGPSSGIFEHELTISYNDGRPPSSDKCPIELDTGCIIQGDILHVEYNDPSDVSGNSNTITDSAVFDLRNGVLQSDKTTYVIGSNLILTLIEPDLNLDSNATESYTLDLIRWNSDAGTTTLADTIFKANPFNLLETADDSGVFQVVITVPSEVNGNKLDRDEEITLKYTDHGPAGSDYVGHKDEDIITTIYTSNHGAAIALDQRIYTWTDKVFITITAPDHNIDAYQIDEIGNNDNFPIRISTRGHEIEEYKIVETNSDTGIFTGEVILTGFAHDANGDGNNDAPTAKTSSDGSGPTNGKIEVESESGISVSFKYSDGETVSASALVRWNVGEVEWLEASYPATGTGIVRIIDPDMNLNPEAVDNFDVTVWSDSDSGGINLIVAETSDATGIFEGSVVFGVGVDTSGHRLRVSEGDTVTAQYYDNTLPAPFKETERVRIGATTLIGTIVPPLQRAPISDLRAVDSFGNTLDVISVDSQIQLTADLTNGQDREQDFAYLIQIQDDNNVTVSLNWVTGTLAPGQSFSPASSWTPIKAGTYTVTAFVWKSIDNPIALSPVSTIGIVVN